MSTVAHLPQNAPVRPWEPPAWVDELVLEQFEATGADPRRRCAKTSGHPAPEPGGPTTYGKGQDWLDADELFPWGVFRYRTQNGMTKWRLACVSCGAQSKDLPEWMGLEVEQEAFRELIEPDEEVAATVECEVGGCVRLGYEIHHWAPRQVFGEDVAELWPTAKLCSYHHHQWHEAMSGYEWGGLSPMRKARARRQQQWAAA